LPDGAAYQRSARGSVRVEPGIAAQPRSCVGVGSLSVGYAFCMEADVVIRSVERVHTRSGKVRYVVRADDGREFSTFRERIGEEAEGYQGQRVHIEYHEEERAGFHNVYLDRVRPAPDAPDRETADTDPEEAAWRTAVEATPWLVGSGEPEREVPPEELFERLKPFKDRVSEDIRSDEQ
jgi:hypothetical protein